jgi:hypothetical protein
VANSGSEAVELTSLWLPHGRFRSEEAQLEPPPQLPAGASLELPSVVRFVEEPGSIVENGFLILTSPDWQVFARLRITAGRGGEPRADVESVTCQRAGTLGS